MGRKNVHIFGPIKSDLDPQFSTRKSYCEWFQIPWTFSIPFYIESTLVPKWYTSPEGTRIRSSAINRQNSSFTHWIRNLCQLLQSSLSYMYVRVAPIKNRYIFSRNEDLHIAVLWKCVLIFITSYAHTYITSPSGVKLRVVHPIFSKYSNDLFVNYHPV